jgi:hypothetical protein
MRNYVLWCRPFIYANGNYRPGLRLLICTFTCRLPSCFWVLVLDGTDSLTSAERYFSWLWVADRRVPHLAGSTCQRHKQLFSLLEHQIGISSPSYCIHGGSTKDSSVAFLLTFNFVLELFDFGDFITRSIGFWTLVKTVPAFMAMAVRACVTSVLQLVLCLGG